MPAVAESPSYDYAPHYIAEILSSVKTIAIVGASADETKDSNDVLRVLQGKGYKIFPVNPHAKGDICGLKTYASLHDIGEAVDMVDVFRPKQELYDIAEQAIAIGAKVLWGQLDIYDDRAADLAIKAGLKVVMDRCPKIEFLKQDNL